MTEISEEVKENDRIRKESDFYIPSNSFIQEKPGNIYDEYMITNTNLGEGAFGFVRKGVHKKSGCVRAIKFIRKVQMISIASLIKEVEILRKIVRSFY